MWASRASRYFFLSTVDFSRRFVPFSGLSINGGFRTHVEFTPAASWGGHHARRTTLRIFRGVGCRIRIFLALLAPEQSAHNFRREGLRNRAGKKIGVDRDHSPGEVEGLGWV